MNAEVLDLDPALSSARRAFDHWRGSRSRRGRTPLELQRQAVALLEQHCAFHVCKTLGINAMALKRWADKRDLPDSASEGCRATDGAAGFIKLPDILETSSVAADDVGIGSLIIELPNQTVVRIGGSYTLDELFSAAARVGNTVRAAR